MKFALILSFVYIIIFNLIIIFSSRLKITEFQSKAMFALFSIALSAIALNIKGSIGLDLDVHFMLMNDIRNADISFFDFMFVNTNYVGGIQYSQLLTFNMLRWFVVTFFDDNMVLPWICVIIDYTIIGYIYTDWYATTIGKNKYSITPLVVSFSFLPFVNCCSGMRNGLCACLLALGIYLYLYKKKRFLIFALLAFLAATVHPAAIITIPFVLISKINIGIWGYIGVFVLSISAQNVAKWMSQSGNLYLSIIGSKYYTYTSESQYRASRAPLYTVLILIIIFLVIYFVVHFKNKYDFSANGRDFIYSFLAVYMVYILGNIGNYDMVLRPAYVLGPLSPVLCSMILDKTLWIQSKLNSRVQNVIRIICIAGCFICGTYLQIKLASVQAKYFI